MPCVQRISSATETFFYSMPQRLDARVDNAAGDIDSTAQLYSNLSYSSYGILVNTVQDEDGCQSEHPEDPSEGDEHKRILHLFRRRSLVQVALSTRKRERESERRGRWVSQEDEGDTKVCQAWVPEMNSVPNRIW